GNNLYGRSSVAAPGPVARVPKMLRLVPWSLTLVATVARLPEMPRAWRLCEKLGSMPRACPVLLHVGCERHFEPIVAATPHPVRGARCIARGTKETRTPSGVQAVRDDHGHQQPRTPCTPDGVRLRRHSLLYTCNS